MSVVGLDWSTAVYSAAFDLTVNDIHTYYVTVGDHDTPVLVHNCGDDELVTVYHYTDKKGFNGINSTSDIQIKANDPGMRGRGSRSNPPGAYVSIESPEVVNLGKNGLTNAKATHVFEIEVPASSIQQLGDRPVFFSPSGLVVPRGSVLYAGTTKNWKGAR